MMMDLDVGLLQSPMKLIEGESWMSNEYVTHLLYDFRFSIDMERTPHFPSTFHFMALDVFIDSFFFPAFWWHWLMLMYGWYIAMLDRRQSGIELDMNTPEMCDVLYRTTDACHGIK